MNFHINKAIYLQIADYVCEQILLKKWKSNEKIPSVRELAVTLEVNPNTIMRTYAFLDELNIIVTQRGLGYFVAELAYENVLAFKKKEFLTQDLPQIFRSMDLLKINLTDFKKLYQERLKNENK